MFSHLLIGGIDFLLRPASVVNNCCFAVVRDKDSSSSSEKIEHMDMSCDPRLLFLVDKGFDVDILAICHNANEQIGIFGCCKPK